VEALYIKRFEVKNVKIKYNKNYTKRYGINKLISIRHKYYYLNNVYAYSTF